MIKKIFIGFGALIVLLIIIGAVTSLGAVTSHGSKPGNTATTTAPTTAAPTPAHYTAPNPPAPNPKPPPAPKPTHTAPPADQVIARFSGNALNNTGSFTVPADGNWHISYAYENGSTSAGQPENISVTEYGTDGTYDQLLVNKLAIGTGNPNAVPVYSDSEAGQQVYFQVETVDASWQIVVLTGTQ